MDRTRHPKKGIQGEEIMVTEKKYHFIVTTLIWAMQLKGVYKMSRREVTANKKNK